ncbi:filamin-type immunoglobulin domains fbug isoform X2 [Brevipalpus obovatus]|uniref:filamin-type immunoglobulin domains fbug isoform X2 n=1 Tax=Brevipalpus obovatus TaxID=246614 RepID=UPI003D9DB862
MGNDDDIIDGSIMGSSRNFSVSGTPPCAIGSVVEVLINSNGVNGANIQVDATSPSGKDINCLVNETNGQYTAAFTPNEIGEWLISLTYANEHISGSPFSCAVFDINQVKIEGSDQLIAGRESEFIVYTQDAGPGLLEAEMETLNGDVLPVKIDDRKNGLYFLSVLPHTPGRYRLKILFNKVTCKGCPITLTVHHPDEYVNGKSGSNKPVPTPRFVLQDFNARPKNTEPNNISPAAATNNSFNKPKQTSFENISNVKAMRNLNLNDQQQSQIKTQESNKHVGGTPEASHGLTEDTVRWKMSNIHKINVRGKGLKFVPVKRPATFSITAPGFEPDDINITVLAPSSREIPIRMDRIRPGMFEVEYITPEVGEHLIEVTALNQRISGSPYRSSAYDAAKIKVGSIPNGYVGKSISFEIDGSEAGSGNLEILVNGGRVTSEVKSLDNHRFLASFVPHIATVHMVEMKFNEEPVSGSPWSCNVSPSSDYESVRSVIRVFPIDIFPVGQTHSFDISAPSYKKEEIDVNITGFSSRVPVQLRVVDLQNDIFRVYFSVSVVGTYIFEINTTGIRPQSQSFTAKAFDISRVLVKNIPKRCCIGEKCEFQVDASLAGEGQLEIVVNEGEVPNKVHVLGNGKCIVNFEPEAATPHVVGIKFNGQNVPGCPFTIDVSNSSQFQVEIDNCDLVPARKVAKFTMSSSAALLPNSFKVNISAPSGKHIPVNISNVEPNKCQCEFIPTEVGPHLVTIEHSNSSTPILSSPLIVKTYDSSKVIVTKTLFGYVSKPVEFIVDASDAGEGNLEISIKAKNKNVVTMVHPLGGAKFRVFFTPTDASDHIVLVSFNNEPVPESPFVVQIGADMEKVVLSGATLDFAPINQISSLTLLNAINESDIDVNIKGPKGSIVPKVCRVDSGLQIDFNPKTTGEHMIEIKYRGNPIPGSPFSTKVYDVEQIKVKDVPDEIFIGKPVTFLVEAANAGPGNLEVIINNGKVTSNPQALGASQYAITFLPKEVEDHQIDIKFNGELVPGAPYICTVYDLSKLKLHKEGLDRVPVNSVASFFIETHGISLNEKLVSLLGPANSPLKYDLSGNPEAGYKVSFEPLEVGDHLIDVKIGGESISNCPFLIKVYDAKRVNVSEPTGGALGKPVFFSIDASQAGAGNLEIIVSVNNRNVPNYVQSEGNAKFRVNFKPMEASVHNVSVRFNGESVPGSPYSVKIIDSSQSLVPNETLRMASLAKGIEFTVDNKNNAAQNCVVFAIAPSGKKIVADVKKLEDIFKVNIASSEVGPHAITAQLDGVVINGCPFNCNVYDVSKVKVSGLNNARVGKPVTFQVDASLAGEGTLELVVTTRKSSLRAEVVMRSRGLYDVTFVPQEKVTHFINISFNEEDVHGSPFKIELEEMSPGPKNGNQIPRNVNGYASKSNQPNQRLTSSGLVGSTNVAFVDIVGSNLDVKVFGPQKTLVPCKIFHEKDQTKVEYIPKEVGLHRIEVYSNGAPIPEKTNFVEICDPSRVKLIDVQDGVIGREQSFKIDCTWAGRGNMMVSIKAGEIEVPHSIKEISSGVFLVSYVPKSDTPHYIDVRYNDHQAPGCPQMIEIRDPTQSIIVHGAALKSCCPGEPASFLIETGGFATAKNFDVIVTDSAGLPLNIKCYQQKDGSLLAEFTPQRTGPHKIDVLYLDKSVSGSPFTSEVFDASRVTIQQIKSTKFVVNEKIFFSLTRKDAGYAELDVTVTSPLGRHLPIEVKGTPDGEGELIEFIPTVPGKYKIAITFGGVEIPGSPVTFIAQEGHFPVIEGIGLKQGRVHQPVEFRMDARNLTGLPQVLVQGPTTEPKAIMEDLEGVYKVTFVPREVGPFEIKIFWNDKLIPGSPHRTKIVDLESIHPIGGWESLLTHQDHIQFSLNEEKRISFDVSSAGPGELNGSLRTPDDRIEPISVEVVKGDKYLLNQICLTPRKEGEYQMKLNFGDFALPRSPLIGIVGHTRSSDEYATVALRGQGLAGARVDEEAEFILDGTDAGPGVPDITLTGVKADIPIKVTKISERIFRATYTPPIQGIYLLNVLWSGKQVKGCPLKVSILPKCDASRVTCCGEGLKSSTLGEESKVFIDTRKAGPGDLTAHCTGFSKVAFCEMVDQMDGTFVLIIKPQESGRHTLTIKYGGENVPGSPFTLRVAGPPDPSKVRVYGPGIEHGVLPLYQSRFVCDTRGAGPGRLTVRIRGPKGAFKVDMLRENPKDPKIVCKYDPCEPGDYRIEIKWSGEHVPGSPFTVMIFDTQDELNRYTQAQYGRVQRPNFAPNHQLPDPYGSNMRYSIGQLSWRGSPSDF